MHRNRKLILTLISAGLIIFTGIWGGVFYTSPAHADGPVPQYQCRMCHSDNQREITLPSGETLPLLVPIAALDASPHTAANVENPVPCTACHRWTARYQYPHQANPAKTYRDFATEIANNCQQCHYPHRPFHQDDPANSDLPNCVDCHGGHQISRTDQIANTMPAACIACHTDQTPAWAAEYIPSRPGLGALPAASYIGSDRCAGCHDAIYTSWKDTLHARMIQNPADDPTVVVGNFTQPDPDLTFSLQDVVYTIGSQWKQRYITKDENGNFYILPAQWNVATREWVPYHADDWQTREWRQSCGTCHVTGLNTQTWDFVEFGVGCESCHGPGADHAADPENVKLYDQLDDQVCGSCHSRGTSPQGFAFPASYHPGDTLTDHFAFTTAESAVWPDGSAKEHHQQYMDWQLGSKMAKSGKVNCVTCHSPHTQGAAQHQLKQPLNNLCLQCHSDKKHLLQHTPFHEQASREHQFLCSDCHLPKMATSAVPYDISNHSFLQPNPQGTIDHGGLDTMLNACNTCHTDPGETAQWAADTIAYAQAIATPAPASLFIPGATFTPPPPPTPLPSVGQSFNAEQYKVNTGRWIRVLFFIFVVLVIAGVLYLIFRTSISGRTGNA